MVDDHIPFRDYVDSRLEALDRRITELDTNSKLSVNKAEHALTARLDAMNEFRGSLNDLANRAATRNELDAVKEKVGDIGRTAAVSAALIAVLVSIVIALVSKWVQ